MSGFLWLAGLAVAAALWPKKAEASTPAPGPTPEPTPGPTPAPVPGTVWPMVQDGPGGVEFGAKLPEGIAEREQAILYEAERGNIDFGGWVFVTSTVGDHTAQIPVTRRALAVGKPEDRLIFSTTFNTAQKIADLVGAHLPTSRIRDLAWRQATVKLPSLMQNWNQDGTGSTTKRMREYDTLIKLKVGDQTGLTSNEGKDWIITSRNFAPPEGTGVELPEGKCKGTPPNKVCSRHNGANFGYYGGGGSKSPGGERVHQPIGLAHNRSHVDYSQLITLVGDPIVDGVPMKLEDVARDPVLFRLVTDEGMPLPSVRHPDLPRYAPGTPSV